MGFVRGVALLLGIVAAAGCQRTPAARLVQTPKYEPQGQAKCSVTASQARPLVVEWPAADRASLEARLARGLVAVHAQGCDLEVLRQCAVPGAYGYLGLTRKNEQVTIRDVDDLYAKLPLGAVNLEGKLARSGRLDVQMALVGMLEAPGTVDRGAMTGDCGRATHFISGAQIGAFVFSAGGTAEIGADVSVKNAAGVGGRSAAAQETLNSDGDPKQCDQATTADTRPPEGCGAVLRIELTPLGAPVCPTGSAWDGRRCVVTQVFCPQGMDVVDGRCVQPAPAPIAAQPRPSTPPEHAPWQSPGPVADADPDGPVCRDYCALELRCKAEQDGMQPPEGAGASRLTKMCERFCRFGLTDYNRPTVRQCVSDGCPGLLRCTTKFSGV